MTESEWLSSADPQRMLRYLTHERHEAPGEAVGDHPRIPLIVSDRKLRRWLMAVGRADPVSTPWPPAMRVLYGDEGEAFADGLLSEAALIRALRAADPEGYGTHVDDAASDAGFTAEQATKRGNGRLAADILRDAVGNPWHPMRLPADPSCRACGGAGRFTLGSGEEAEAIPCRCCRWVTPDVLSLAGAAYGCLQTAPPEGVRSRSQVLRERDDAARGGCCGRFANHTACDCLETAWAGEGSLDHARLGVLSDALEEAGFPNEAECPNVNHESLGFGSGWGQFGECALCYNTGRVPHPLLAHLRCGRPLYRGAWSVDLILGKS